MLIKEPVMSYLNYEFFDEYKSLDNLCRDIYGDHVDKKRGVSAYLEDMDRNAYQGALKIPGWTSDYNRLKSARHMRNELAHSCNSMTFDICSQEDIDFVRSFRERILNQTDPISKLRKRLTQPRPSSTSQPQQRPRPTYTHTAPQKTPAGCLSIVAPFLIVVACVIVCLL